MGVTKEDIKAAIESDSNLIADVLEVIEPKLNVTHFAKIQNKAIGILGSEGFIVRSKNDDKSYIDSQIEARRDEIVSPIVREIHSAYDADFEQLFGEKKKPTEKTYDAYKRKVDELKTSKVTDPVIREQLQQAQATIEKMKSDHENAIQKMAGDFSNKELDMMLSQSLEKRSIAIPPHITTEEQKQAYVNKQRGMLKSDFRSSFVAKKDTEGNTVFYQNDKPVLSKQDQKPLDADAIIEEQYSSYFIKTAQQKKGLGLKLNSEGMSTFATKEEAYADVKSRGFAERTKAFTDEYEKVCKENGLAK